MRPACSNRVRRRRCCTHFDSVVKIATIETQQTLSSTDTITLLLQALATTSKDHAELGGFESLIYAHALESLNHFVTCDRSWLKSPAVQAVIQRTATQRVSNRAYLLQTIPAISAAHLAYYKPGKSRSYWMASRAHFQLPLSYYTPNACNEKSVAKTRTLCSSLA